MRGSAICGRASLLNHECLPNTARFDGFDARTPAGTPGDTSLRFVALHDIPAGEELTASYFPLTCTYEERQQRCRDVYGFECRCARCQVRLSLHGCPWLCLSLPTFPGSHAIITTSLRALSWSPLLEPSA